MGLTELILAALVIGVPVITVVICVVILWRTMLARRAAEEKYRQAREARSAAEQALRRAEEESRTASVDFRKAHEERNRSDESRLEAQTLLEKTTLERAGVEQWRQQAEQTHAQAEQEHRQAESERAQAEQTLKLATNERLAAQSRLAEAQKALGDAVQERVSAQAELAKAEEIARTSAEELKQANLARGQAEEQARIEAGKTQKAIQDQQQAEERADSLLRALVDTERKLQETVQSEHEAIADRDQLTQVLTATEARLQREESARLRAEAERDEALNAKNQVLEEQTSARRQLNDSSAQAQQLKSKLELTEQELETLRNKLAQAIPTRDTLARKTKLKRPPRRGLNWNREDKQTDGAELPEVVCIEREHLWHLTLETPEQLAVRDTHQNGLPLEPDNWNDNSWQLAAAYGKIEIDSKYAVPEIELGSANDNCVLFKLIGKKQQKQGRRVQTVNSGAYLFVVPEAWQPTDSLLFSEPLFVSTAGYHAFYCVLTKNDESTLAFRTSLGQTRVVKSGKQKFELVGNRIDDDSEDIGPLFGGELPTIHALNCDDWNEVSAIAMGEEGSGKPDWEANVILRPSGRYNDIQVDTTNLKGTWFFVRLYDQQDQLIESVDFRYIQGLRKIKIDRPDPLPIGRRHSPLRVEFHHSAGCLIEPATEMERQVPIECQDLLTVIQVPASADLDETAWNITSPDGETGQVRVLVERVWWAVGDENTEPSTWGDESIVLRRPDIAATSSRALWLRVPKPDWADRIELSLGSKLMLPLLLKSTEKTGVLALRNFRDHQAIDLIGEAPLLMKILHEGKSHLGVAGKLFVEALCKITPCDLVITDRKELAQHFQIRHLNRLFRPLTYEEYREIHPELPSRIAICLFDPCGYVAQSYGSENVTDLITEHIRQNRHYDKEGRVRFRELFRVDEIREVLPGIQLPYSFKCTRPGCGYVKELTSQSPAAMAELVQHWFEQHAKYLYEIR